MNKYPSLNELEKMFYELNGSTKGNVDLQKVVSVERGKVSVVDGNEKCYCGTGNCDDTNYTVAFFIDNQKLYITDDQIECYYLINGFNDRGKCIYDATVIHTFSENKNELYIETNEIGGTENKNHGIGTAGIQIVIQLAKFLNCNVVCGAAHSYYKSNDLSVRAKDDERLRNFYKKNGFVFKENNIDFSMKL